MSDIDGVEAHKRREQPPICLGEPVAQQITLPGQPLFQITLPSFNQFCGDLWL